MPAATRPAAVKYPKARRITDFRKLFDHRRRVRRRGRQHLRAHPRLRHAAGPAARQARLLRKAADAQHLGGPRDPRGRRQDQGRHADGHPDPRRRQLPPRRRADPDRRHRRRCAKSTSGSSRAWGRQTHGGGQAESATSSPCSERPSEGRCRCPAGLDWDLWLGPAPARPFQRGLFSRAEVVSLVGFRQRHHERPGQPLERPAVLGPEVCVPR